jgi:broad specificity phosphatase PhoE
MKLYFVRHGESEANLRHEFSNRGHKHGLTTNGKAQAATLAYQLRGAGVTHLFSRPLLRALETTAILARQCGVTPEVTEALREYDCGILEGKSDADSWTLYDTVWRDWLQHGRWDSRIEHGESFLDIKDRFVPFIERLVQHYADTRGAIVLVGHGGTYRCMLPLVLVNIDFAFALAHPISHTGYIVAEPHRGALVCAAWCEHPLPCA